MIGVCLQHFLKTIGCFIPGVSRQRIETEVNLSCPAAGVEFDHCPITGRRITEDATMHTAERGQRDQQDSTESIAKQLLPSFKAIQEEQRSRRHRCNNSDNRQVLKMIGDERKTKKTDVEKTKERQQRGDKEKQPCQRSAPARSQPPCHSENEKCGNRKEILPPFAGIHFPARVHEREIGWPEDFAEVEPERPSSNEHSLHYRKFRYLPLGAAELPLHPDAEEAGYDPEHDERNQELNIAFPFQFAALPPQHDQYYCGQRSQNRFRHHPQ